LNTLVNFRPAQPSKTGQFSTGVNTHAALGSLESMKTQTELMRQFLPTVIKLSIFGQE
jgi:hypothetical protein